MAQQLGNNYYNSPYKFNGKELDEETGFYYYGARYYDPRISIWQSVDPLAEQTPNINPYVYCNQNPIKYIDPTGMSTEEGDPPKKNWAQRTWGRFVNWLGFGKNEKSSNSKTTVTVEPLIGPTFENTASATVGAGVAIGAESSGIAWAEVANIITKITVAASNALVVVGAFSCLNRDTPRKEDRYITLYRAMSLVEYESTGGLLVDLKNSGEGPHVRADVGYLENANFINAGNYDVIVKYDISLEAFAAFNSTPFKYTPGTGKGSPVFDAARKAGVPYMKLEKGVSYGFPGLVATQLFNASINGVPQIYSTIKR